MSSSKFVVIETQNGPVKGSWRTTALGRNYASFRSIPYMKAPVGKLRFRDAEKPDKWTEVLDTTGDRPSYLGLDFITQAIVGQEDAGILTVATPSLDRKFPVAVYIHGGGFQYPYGTSELAGPDYLLQKDLVYVTINYRVGAFGFLSLEDPELKIPGNAGLKDMVLALKWVRDNISRFGGDPDNVTIFGTSAGGVSCHLLMMSDLAKGLFHRAIPMSGTSFNKTWPFSPNKEISERLAKALGWDGSGGEKEMLKILENVDAKTLCASEMSLLTSDDTIKRHVLFTITPVIEPYKTANSFLTEDPVLAGRKAWSNDIDCILGFTSLEGGLMNMFPDAMNFDSIMSPEHYLPLQELNNRKIEMSKMIEYGEKIKKLYFGNEKDNQQRQYKLYAGDIHFGYGVYRALLSRINSDRKGKSYLYRFDIQSSLNFSAKLMKVVEEGATHGEDMNYMFKLTPIKGMTISPTIDSPEHELIKKVTSFITSFIINGNPNEFKEEASFEPIHDKNQIKCYNLTSEKFEMTPLPEAERFKVWNEILKDAKVDVY